MKENIEEQILFHLKKAQKILIALPEHFTADGLASALAVLIFLEKLGKNVEVVCSAPVPEKLKFLPGINKIQTEPQMYESLVLVLNTASKELTELSYQTEESKLKIFLKSKTNKFIPEDVSFITDNFPVDLIVTIEAKSLDDLGVVFEKHADLFYAVPKINIDHSPGNEYYATINMVDLTASSISEILGTMFQKYEKQHLNEDLATCLLTGIITKTQNFQHSQVTPKTFLLASELIALGGRQQEVVKHIFKTKSLNYLKLWGRVLARIKTEAKHSCLYSLLSLSDFEKIGTPDPDLIPVFLELLGNVSNYRFIALLAEPKPGSVVVVLASEGIVSGEKVVEVMGLPSRIQKNGLSPHEILQFTLSNTTLETAEEKLLFALSLA